MTGGRFGTLTESANTAGACLAGVLPHRSGGGTNRPNKGLDAAAMLNAPLNVTLLFGCEPDADILATDNAAQKLASQTFVTAFTPFISDALKESADLLLPIGTFAETAGTFINCEAKWQSFTGVANPVGQSRPAWKVLRVLGNLLDAADFDYESSEEIRDEVARSVAEVRPGNGGAGKNKIKRPGGADTAEQQIDVPIYQVDGLVRRAAALQLTPEAKRVRGDVS
jgi:NADH-quinone oxidoreductase subunit G